MRVVYIAGPHDARSDDGISANVRRAEVAAMEVWSRGAAAICPHTNSPRPELSSQLPRSVWLFGDLELMRRSDAVLLLEGWDASLGAIAEREEAIRLGKPCLYELSQLDVWLCAQETKD